MATLNNKADNVANVPTALKTGGVNPSVKTTPANYTTIGSLVDDYAKPDNRDLLIKTYGDQGITGFLKLTGAVNAAATQDEVQYWEEGRRHVLVTATIGGTGTTATVSAGAGLRVNDVVMDTASGTRAFVDATTTGGADDASETVFSILPLDGSTLIADGASKSLVVLGNMYAQGTSQPDGYFEPDLIKRVNPFMIMKEKYKVNGSQATNIGWVNIGGGEYRWYLKGEQEARTRFENEREMMTCLMRPCLQI